MEQTVFYQEGLGNWKKRVDEVSLRKWLYEAVWVYRFIIIPHYWHKIARKLNLED